MIAMILSKGVNSSKNLGCSASSLIPSFSLPLPLLSSLFPFPSPPLPRSPSPDDPTP